VGHVGPRHEEAAAEIPPRRRPVGAGQRPVGQPRRPDDGPVQAAVAQDVLHQGQVVVDVAERGDQQRHDQVAGEEPVARVVARRMGAAGRGHGGDRGGADDHDAPDAGGRHGPDDGPRAPGGDAGLGPGAGAEAGEHRVGAGHRRLEGGGVGGGQVGDLNGPNHAGQRPRVADHGGDVMAGLEGLPQELAADPAGGREDRKLHLQLPGTLGPSIRLYRDHTI
jgi:hypothetical protein